MMYNQYNDGDPFNSKCDIMCGQCRYFDGWAHEDGHESKCKRLDHKHIRFAKSVFIHYDCGRIHHNICMDFEPDASSKHLYDNWTTLEDHFDGCIPTQGYVGLVLDGDNDYIYRVLRKDFMENTFLNEDGSLKWWQKEYTVPIRGATSWTLVYEYPCGLKSKCQVSEIEKNFKDKNGSYCCYGCDKYKNCMSWTREKLEGIDIRKE